jgi:outer membrane protein OmpA-like peptidoglycan-associated protein
MKRFVQAVLTLSLLTPLAACEYYKLEELKTAEPTGSVFQKALWSNYRDLSRQKEQRYDWSQAVGYADKALRAAYGEDVLPEDPAQWEFPDSLSKQFDKARDDLMQILSGDAKSVEPQLVADAQTHFDCWLENQAERFNQDDIVDCREAFYDDLQQLLSPEKAKEMGKHAALDKAARAPVMAKKKAPALIIAEKKALAPEPAFEPAPAVEEKKELEPMPSPLATPNESAFSPPPEPEPVVEPKPHAEVIPALEPVRVPKEIETASYIVFFDAGQATLTPTAEKIVAGAAQSLVSHKHYRVIVNARTDLFGNIESDLPAKRADAVKQRLILQGVSADAVEILAGEASPASGSSSSAPPIERRVEIFISE